jgi:glutamate formiminotransferase
MSQPLVECVPNFSEGRDPAVVDAIAAAIEAHPGVLLLDREMDPDHHRSVLTFAAPPGIIVEAAVAGVARAAQLIDLNRHRGVHPRLGACDVLPFVPLQGVTLDECVRLAGQAAEAVWQRLGIPVYLYEAAARRPERARLENIRRGEFEGVREAVLHDPDRRPDIGGPALHPTAGALTTGARPFLIAWNVNLNTPDVAVAKRIARRIRQSSGGFPCLKALGLPLESKNLAQVSMNLTNFEVTPVHTVFEAIKAEAARDGIAIAGTEIIGLIPKSAIEGAAGHFLQIEDFRPSMILENRVAEVSEGRAWLTEFLDSLASPAEPSGGGSAAAAAAAMAAALGALAARHTGLEPAVFEQDRAFFTRAAAADATAWQSVVQADDDREARQQALRAAAEVPMQVIERAAELDLRLARLMAAAPGPLASELETARALVTAAVAGARSTVRMNLAGIESAEVRQSFRIRLDAVQAHP